MAEQQQSNTVETEVERLVQLMIAISVGGDRDGVLASELEHFSSRINALTGSHASRVTRELEQLAVALGIALYEHTGSLLQVSDTLANHWSKA